MEKLRVENGIFRLETPPGSGTPEVCPKRKFVSNDRKFRSLERPEESFGRCPCGRTSRSSCRRLICGIRLRYVSSLITFRLQSDLHTG